MPTRKRHLQHGDKPQLLTGENRLANKLWLKVADTAAMEEDYYRAIDKYEKVAEQAIVSWILSNSVLVRHGFLTYSSKTIL